MGILHVTPDSFADGGRHRGREAAVARALEMAAEGADIIDVGGESTRPGAEAVAEAEELERVIPVIEALRSQLDCVISVDTSKPAVMRAAVAAGAGLINDVFALRQPGALATAAELGVDVCLMHMQGEPRTMQAHPRYADVVAEVCSFLTERTEVCAAAGLLSSRMILDPGFGFGKDLAHNLALVRALPRLVALGFPVMVGFSRKSMVGALTGRPVGERLHGSLALVAYAALHGASIVRVHDVAATVDVLRVIAAVEGVSGNG
ncbi:MAG: dihydropteroate synthase [Gammaproteobacteria bacterium]|nr:dihydropteroate synthase [Gammaproteobacteria bacterium]